MRDRHSFVADGKSYVCKVTTPGSIASVVGDNVARMPPPFWEIHFDGTDYMWRQPEDSDVEDEAAFRAEVVAFVKGKTGQE